MKRANIKSEHPLQKVGKMDSPTANHFRPATASAKKKIASLNLNRVAGNVYECPSTKDFWKVNGSSVIRISSKEVDNGEKISQSSSSFNAPNDDIFSDLEF